jgi:phage shock protein PspC (stress-responsive transcriptional regulator)
VVQVLLSFRQVTTSSEEYTMPKLYRARHDRKFLGVCGGIARSYGYDPTPVRIGTVVLAIAIPGPSLLATLAVYIVLAAIIPVNDTY